MYPGNVSSEAEAEGSSQNAWLNVMKTWFGWVSMLENLLCGIFWVSV